MSNLLDALWVEYLDRDAESTDAEFKLLTAARAGRGVASVWANDHSLDCSLRSLNHLMETEEAFVAEWEQRVQKLAEPSVGEPSLAEPPVAAPPVPSVQFTSVQIAARAATGQRATRSFHPTQATAALIATVALLALVAASFWIFRGDGGLARREAPQPKSNSPTKDNRATNPKNSPNTAEPEDQPFRFVLPTPDSEPARITPVVWQTGGPRNNRLPRGEHRLTSGLVELIGGEATPVTISAPASVQVGDDDSWFVQRGTISVSDLPSGQRLPIVTPNSRIDSQGAEFVVTVNDAGQTDLQVRRGEVHLLAGTAGENAAPLKLLAGEFERAQLSPPGKEPGNCPAFCQLQGPADRFCGLIQLDGKTLRFASPEEFQEFQQQVEKQFAKDAEELRQQWPDLVRALGGLGGGEIQLQLDGEPLEIQTLEQLLEFLKKLPIPPGELKPAIPKPGALPGIPGDAKGAGGFQGSIIINGQEQKFNSVEEFNAARKKMLDQLGPLGPLGPLELPDLDPFKALDQLKLPAPFGDPLP